MPVLQSRVTDEERPSACEQAYQAATRLFDGTAPTPDSDVSLPWQPLMVRYAAARQAADQWVEVAAACPIRFEEAVLRSAQAGAMAETMAGKLGVSPSKPQSVDFSEVFRLTVSPEALAAMSLAEDRAGFAIEILAARDVPGATLALSDNHKAAAQHLFTLSGLTSDPRHKVYDTTALVKHPNSTVDGVTGLATPTAAAVEMDLVRSYLSAMRDAQSAGNKAGVAADSSDSSSVNGNGKSADTSGNSADKAAVTPKTLRIMAQAIAARAHAAFDLGFPTFDAALFEP